MFMNEPEELDRIRFRSHFHYFCRFIWRPICFYRFMNGTQHEKYKMKDQTSDRSSTGQWPPKFALAAHILGKRFRCADEHRWLLDPLNPFEVPIDSFTQINRQTTKSLLMFWKKRTIIYVSWGFSACTYLLFIPLQSPASPLRISIGVELDVHDVRVAGTGGGSSDSPIS